MPGVSFGLSSPRLATVYLTGAQLDAIDADRQTAERIAIEELRRLAVQILRDTGRPQLVNLLGIMGAPIQGIGRELEPTECALVLHAVIGRRLEVEEEDR
jgi:hypothetical protein